MSVDSPNKISSMKAAQGTSPAGNMPAVDDLLNAIFDASRGKDISPDKLPGPNAKAAYKQAVKEASDEETVGAVSFPYGSTTWYAIRTYADDAFYTYSFFSPKDVAAGTGEEDL